MDGNNGPSKSSLPLVKGNNFQIILRVSGETGNLLFSSKLLFYALLRRSEESSDVNLGKYRFYVNSTLFSTIMLFTLTN